MGPLLTIQDPNWSLKSDDSGYLGSPSYMFHPLRSWANLLTSQSPKVHICHSEVMMLLGTVSNVICGYSHNNPGTQAQISTSQSRKLRPALQQLVSSGAGIQTQAPNLEI